MPRKPYPPAPGNGEFWVLRMEASSLSEAGFGAMMDLQSGVPGTLPPPAGCMTSGSCLLSPFCSSCHFRKRPVLGTGSVNGD